jgi:hypothetical protein
MTAALTFQPEVHARPQDFPFMAATGVLFFQAYDVAQFIRYFVHTLFLSKGG